MNLQFGSACSGTDVYGEASSVMLKLIAGESMSSLNSRTAFTCDHATPVMKYLNQSERLNQEDYCHFPKAETLADEKAWCEKHRAMCTVPTDIHIYSQGFSCTAISHFHTKSKDHQATINDKSGNATVESFHAGVKYLKRTDRSLYFACLENSDALDDQDVQQGESNLDQCGQVLLDAGFLHFAIRVNTMDYGVPQLRRRWYMGVVPRWKVEGGIPEAMSETFMSEMQQLMEFFKDQVQDHRSLENVLLDDNDPLVTEELQSLQATQRHVASKKGRETCVLWPSIHIQAFSDAGFRCPAIVETASDRLRSSVWFQALSLRAQQCVIYGEMKGALTLDCSQDIRRCRINKDHPHYIGSITPSQQVWIFSKNRLMVAAEMLAIQAVPLHEGCTSTMTFKQLAHLAGNAFTGTVCAAHFLACFTKVYPVIAKMTDIERAASSHHRVSEAPGSQQSEVIESSQESAGRNQPSMPRDQRELSGEEEPESPLDIDPESLCPDAGYRPASAEQYAFEDSEEDAEEDYCYLDYAGLP